MYFTNDQTAQIKELADQLEKKTGVELVISVVGRCDNYPEIPWKAFSFFTAVSALISLTYFLFFSHWISVESLIIHTVVALGSGAAAALLTTFWAGFARIFLDKDRAEGETEQYANSYFMEKEIFNTKGHVGILIIVGLFEHQVVILADSGIRNRLKHEKLQDVIREMTRNLKAGDRLTALVQGISILEERLIDAGFKGVPGAVDQISDEFTQERGMEK